MRPPEVGLIHAADLNVECPDQKKAYSSVRGFGPVTWEYFTMLLGQPGVKADTWIRRYVSPTNGPKVSYPYARDLVKAAAESLGVTATELDHAIWDFARRASKQS